MAERQPIINLEWIDQEVRGFRNELISAQQTIETQAEDLRQQARQIEDLEGRLAGVNNQLSRITLLERSLEQYKEEIRLLLEQQEESFQQDRHEASRIKLIEQDNLNRTLGELRKAQAPIGRLGEEIALREAEEQRLNEICLALRQKIMDMEKQLDIGLRPIAYLQEQQSRSAKYVAQLQEQSSTLLKRTETADNRLSMVQETSQRNQQRVEELITVRQELQQEQRRFIEEMQLNDHHRQRLVSEWSELEDNREQRIGEFSEQMRLFTDQAKRIQDSLSSLELVGERLQQEQHQVSELQRLAEERQKSRMAEWESQAEKRWQREKLLWEQQWNDHNRRAAEELEQVEEIQTRSQENETQIGGIWETLLDDLRLRNETAQSHLIRLSEQAESRRNRRKIRR